MTFIAFKSFDMSSNRFYKLTGLCDASGFLLLSDKVSFQLLSDINYRNHD